MARAAKKKNVVRFPKPWEKLPPTGDMKPPGYVSRVAEAPGEEARVRLQDLCARLLATRKPLTMSTSHVDDHLLDDLLHELVRQGVDVKRKT